MLSKQRSKVTFSIRAVIASGLVFGLVHSNTFGMGFGERIDGLLDRTVYGPTINGCVLTGRNLTGQGVEAISYTGGNLRCDIFSQVDGLITDAVWCSQWVLAGSPDLCTGGNGQGNNGGGKKSPIMLDLDRNNFHLSGDTVSFDIDSDGLAETVNWVPPDSMDGFLYLDRNGNGLVDSGLELFGDATLLMNQLWAEHGYEALGEFDLPQYGGNLDGMIDQLDSVYSQLGVWTDTNANGITDPGETMSLINAGVRSLELDYKESRRTDQFGNEFRYVAKGWIMKNGELKKMWTTDVFLVESAN